jgi:hypothetical protein
MSAIGSVGSKPLWGLRQDAMYLALVGGAGEDFHHRGYSYNGAHGIWCGPGPLMQSVQLSSAPQSHVEWM